jgi:hypothetical protein
MNDTYLEPVAFHVLCRVCDTELQNPDTLKFEWPLTRLAPGVTVWCLTCDKERTLPSNYTVEVFSQ